MEEKSKKRGLLILIPIALLLLFVMIDREPPPPEAVEPPAPVQNAGPEVVAESEIPEAAPLMASAMLEEPAPEPAPAPPPKRVRKAKPEPPKEPPPEEAQVEEPPPEEAPPPPEEPPVEEPKEEEVPPPPPPPPVFGGIEVSFEDDLSFVRPVSVQVAIDGNVVALKQLQEGQGEDAIAIHKGDLPVGTHTMDFQIKLLGDGGGFFSYVESYVFTAKQHAVIEVKEKEKVRILIKTFERSAMEAWEKRVGLRVEVQPKT